MLPAWCGWTLGGAEQREAAGRGLACSSTHAARVEHRRTARRAGAGCLHARASTATLERAVIAHPQSLLLALLLPLAASSTARHCLRLRGVYVVLVVVLVVVLLVVIVLVLVVLLVVVVELLKLVIVVVV